MCAKTRSHAVWRNTLGMSRLSFLGAFAIIFTLFAILVPMVKRQGGVAAQTVCQSNLKQIAAAFQLYSLDWGDSYPTNRCYGLDRSVGEIRPSIPLSESASRGAFQYGVNWVDGIQHYLPPRKTDQESIWRCPIVVGRAEAQAYQSTGVVQVSGVTYAFNGNLVEKCQRVVRNQERTLMLRELDRCADAELRPVNDSQASELNPPVSPLLSTTDSVFGRTDPAQHKGGSNIVLADGHAKWFDSSSFPPDGFYTQSNCWDPDMEQWYNYGPNAADKPAQFRRSIAITP